MDDFRDNEIDLSEIRDMIDESALSDEYSLDEIINEVKDAERLEDLARLREEEQKNPFASFLRVTGELHEDNDDTADAKHQGPEILHFTYESKPEEATLQTYPSLEEAFKKPEGIALKDSSTSDEEPDRKNDDTDAALIEAPALTDVISHRVDPAIDLSKTDTAPPSDEQKRDHSKFEIGKRIKSFNKEFVSWLLPSDAPDETVDQTETDAPFLNTLETDELDTEDSEPAAKRETFFDRVLNNRKDSQVSAQKQQKIKVEVPYDFDRIDFLTADEAVTYYRKKEKAFRTKIIITFILFLYSLYLSLAPTFALWLPFGLTYDSKPYLYLLILAAIQAVAMLVSIEMISIGLMRLINNRPNVYSLVTLASFASFIHILTIILFPQWGGYLPLSCVSVLQLFFLLLMADGRKIAVLRSLTTLGSGRENTLKAEECLNGEIRINRGELEDEPEYLKDVFAPGIAERVIAIYVPILLGLILVAAVITTFVQHRGSLFFWALSAFLSTTSTAGIILCSSMPLKSSTKKLMNYGIGLRGYKGVKDLAKADSIVWTDFDLFSNKALVINGTKVFEPYTFEKVLQYSGSLLCEAELGIGRAFFEAMQEEYIKPVKVEELQFFESGGISALINNEPVLLGTAVFALRMGVRVPEEMRIKNGIYIAVNKRLAGIFAMKYKDQPVIEEAFRLVKTQKSVSIIASRCFNITPSMVEKRFNAKARWIEYPDIQDRLDISSQTGEAEGESLATIAREGMMPITECITMTKKLYRALIANLIWGLIGSVIGFVLMTFLVLKAAVVSVTPVNVLIFILLWIVPIWVNTIKASKY